MQKARYKRVNGKRIGYGQKGASVKPGTSKGDSYCARSAGQMKAHPAAAKDSNSLCRWRRTPLLTILIMLRSLFGINSGPHESEQSVRWQ